MLLARFQKPQVTGFLCLVFSHSTRYDCSILLSLSEWLHLLVSLANVNDMVQNYGSFSVDFFT